jgi:hypothetical protein
MSATFLPRRDATCAGSATSTGRPWWRGSCCRGSASRSTWRRRPDAQHLEHGAHRTTGDDPGAFRRGAHDDLAGAVTALDVVVQRAAFLQRHADQAALGLLGGLADASGTSLALPLPKPTRPFWSPTTTSAAKPKRLPPFTVLETRLIATRRSANSGVSRGRGGVPGLCFHVLPCGMSFDLVTPRSAGCLDRGGLLTPGSSRAPRKAPCRVRARLRTSDHPRGRHRPAP